MPRPPVLLVHPEAASRKDLSRGLTSLGYEVIPALDAAQGRRFAEELAGAVVVAPLGFGPPAARAAAALPDAAGGGAGEAARGAEPRTWLLLGERDEDGVDLPEDVSFLATGGLTAAELVHRVHVLLLGREVGVAADARLEALVGDLVHVSFLELLRALHRAELSGRLVHAAGEVTLVGGEVAAAAAGASRGVKAFCRLSHLDAGTVRVVPAAADDEVALGRAGGGEREIRLDLKSLIIRALEDKVHDAPDLRARPRRVGDAGSGDGRYLPPSQREVLAAIPGVAHVGGLLDALPATDGEIVRALRELAGAGMVAIEEPALDPVQVVTDSTCDLPAALARAHGIQVVPLLVIFGDRIFHDGIDLGPHDFYQRLAGGPAAPRTSPPLKEDFLRVYRAVAERRDIFSLHLSERLSQTVVAARAVADEARPGLAAARAAGERPLALAVADSGSISLGLGLQALFAARMARRGRDVAAIAGAIDAMHDRLHVLFVVDTLDYLVRGGRIGKARAVVGKVLGVKPILGVVGGEVVAVDRVRGGRAAHPRLIELFAERIDPALPVVAAIGHAQAPIWADRLRALLEQRFTVAELLVTEIGPVVGTHSGPGAVGAALFQPTAEELPLIAPLGELAS